MKFAFLEHNNRGALFARALLKAGHQIDQSDPDILLIDHDAPPYYQKIIDLFPRAKIVLYPHGEPVLYSWDGLWEVNSRTKLCLSSSPGNTEIMQRYGYPAPLETIGWTASKILPFAPAAKIERVLFAPIHPLNNGFLHPHYRHLNANAYSSLLQMPFDLTVRHIGNLAANSLWPVPDVEYIRGDLDGNTDDIKSVDVIVTNRATFGSMAVALGKPVVMYGQDQHPFDAHGPDDTKYVQHWDAWRDYAQFPYDLSVGYTALEQAAQTEPANWKRRFIGAYFDADKFVRLLCEL